MNRPSLIIGTNDPFDYFPLRPSAHPSKMGLRKFMPAERGINNHDSVVQVDGKYIDVIHYKKRCMYSEPEKYFQYRGLPLDNVYTWLSKELLLEGIMSLEEIALCIQEDIVVQCFDGEHNWAEFIHLCLANGWSAQEVVGKPFDWIHKEVPNIDKIVKEPKTSKMIQAIIDSEYCFERLAAISFNTSPEINRHPSFPDPRKNAFDSENPQLFIRFERQVCKGFDKVNTFLDSPSGFLFLIKTYMVDVAELNKEKLDCVIRTFEECVPKLYHHTFVNNNKETVLPWLYHLRGEYNGN